MLPVAAKILPKIILETHEGLIDKDQVGLPSRSSRTDHIYTLQLIMEYYAEIRSPFSLSE